MFFSTFKSDIYQNILQIMRSNGTNSILLYLEFLDMGPASKRKHEAKYWFFGFFPSNCLVFSQKKKTSSLPSHLSSICFLFMSVLFFPPLLSTDYTPLRLQMLSIDPSLEIFGGLGFFYPDDCKKNVCVIMWDWLHWLSTVTEAMLLSRQPHF